MGVSTAVLLVLLCSTTSQSFALSTSRSSVRSRSSASCRSTVFASSQSQSQSQSQQLFGGFENEFESLQQQPSAKPAASSVPGFSGFGHAATAPTSVGSGTNDNNINAPATNAAVTPVFSGFGHSVSGQLKVPQVDQEIQAVEQKLQAVEQEIQAVKLKQQNTAPLFSGFGHATPVAPAAAPAPAFSGFGHATPVARQVHAELVSPAQAPPPPPAPIFSGFGKTSVAQPSHGAFGAANGIARPEGIPEVVAPPPVRETIVVDAVVVEDDREEDEVPLPHFDANVIQASMATMDPDLKEATSYLYAARDKVIQLRDEITHKEGQQRQLVEQLKMEIKDKDKGFEEKLTGLADKYQQNKMDAHQEKLNLQESLAAREQQIYDEVAVKERKIRKEIATLEAALASAALEGTKAHEAMAIVTTQNTELQAEFEEMRKEYTEASLQWEDRVEMEQTARLKDRALAEQVIQKVKEEAADKIRQARADGRIMSEAVRSDLSNHLWQKETMLQKSNMELKRTNFEKEHLKERIHQLEFEMEDLPTLTKQTSKVAKREANNAMQEARNFFRRNKIG